MIKNYLQENSPKGDLARDMKDDQSFPKNGSGKFKGWKKLIKCHLKSLDVYQNNLKTFETAWEEYEDCERKRLKRPFLKK